MTTDATTPEPRTEAIDVEISHPSVVLSVRLNEQEARYVAGLARLSDKRVSDVLRDLVRDAMHPTTFASGGARSVTFP